MTLTIKVLFGLLGCLFTTDFGLPLVPLVTGEVEKIARV